MNKRWRLKKLDRGRAGELSQDLEVSETLGLLLAARGLGTNGEARSFLDGGWEQTHAPGLIAGMGLAVERLEQALRRREKVVIFGDYDVDGITSTALLMHLLAGLGGDVSYYIPDRLKEGYGLNAGALEKIRASGASLAVTVDCGVSSMEEAGAAKALGLDLIITDHHVPPPDLPPCLALLNPKTSPDYPYPMLAGVGVAFKLAQALLERLERPNRAEQLGDYLELAALGTVADVAPLDGENRILVKEGLRHLRQSRWLGIRCLAEVAGLKLSELNTSGLGFALGPRLNAGGRLGEPRLGVDLLLCADKSQAVSLARQMDEENRKRKKIEHEALDEAKALARMRLEQYDDRVLVLAKEGWHPGVVGLVASRLQEAFNRPSVVVAWQGDAGKGSARSRPPFDMVAALGKCGNLLEHFGGHEAAAGLSIRRENFEAFRLKLGQLAGEILTDDDLRPWVDIDLELPLSALVPDLIKDQNRLSPFGMGNPKPVYAASGCRLLAGTRVVGGEGEHLKVEVGQAGNRRQGIAFRMGADLDALDPGRPVDLAFHLGWNEFQGRREIQMEVLDIRQEAGS